MMPAQIQMVTYQLVACACTDWDRLSRFVTGQSTYSRSLTLDLSLRLLIRVRGTVELRDKVRIQILEWRDHPENPTAAIGDFTTPRRHNWFASAATSAAYEISDNHR